MIIKINAFGQLSEIMGKEISVEATDVVSMKVALQNSYPELAKKKYAVAVNNKLVKSNIEFTATDTVALMPPYSGG